MPLKLALTKKERIERANAIRRASGQDLLDENGNRIYGSAVPIPAPEVESPPEATYEPATAIPEPPLEPLRGADESPSTPEGTPRPRRTGPPAEPLRHTDGYTQIINHLLDDIIPTLEPPEQSVLLRLYRLSRGHWKAHCKVTIGKLVSTTKVKKTKLREVLALLEARGYIKRLPDDVSNPDIRERGMHFLMLLEGAKPGRRADPSVGRTPSRGGPNKEGFKETIKETHTPTAEEIETYERATGRKWGSD